VDFDNDCVGTSLAVARALGDRLYGVRLDTSETLATSRSFRRWGRSNPPRESGAVRNVRRALDADGFQHVRIVVSGGFTVEKIRHFEEQDIPVDVYGVGRASSRAGSISPPSRDGRGEAERRRWAGRTARIPRLERVT